jgi:HEAT repeat protein
MGWQQDLNHLDQFPDLEEDNITVLDEEEDDWEVRFTAVKRISSSKISDDEKLQLLKDYLNDPDASIRYEAVMGLRELTTRDVIESLIYAMSDSYEWVRIRAIEGLGRLQAREAVEIFIKYLDGGESPKVRATLVKHLGSFKEERLVPIIADYLEDEDARVRANAVEGLGCFPSDHVLHILEPFVDDENVRIRANVAVILSRYGISHAKDALQKMITSNDAYERVGAVYSMGEVKKEEHIPILLNHLSDPSFLVQKNARDALIKFGIKIQGILLKEIRNTSNVEFIQNAVQTLGQVGDKKSLKTLFRLRESGDGEVRAHVEEAIDQIIERNKQ